MQGRPKSRDHLQEREPIDRPGHDKIPVETRARDRPDAVVSTKTGPPANR